MTSTESPGQCRCDTSDTKVALKEWITVNENQSGKKVKTIRLDNGGECVDAALESWLREHGILHQTIPVRTLKRESVIDLQQAHSHT